jgi:hypothetical protein
MESEGERGKLTLSPVLNMLDILLRVVQVFKHLLAITTQPVRLRRTTLLHRAGPTSVLDTGGKVTREGICVRSAEIEIVGARGAVVGVEGVHGLHFTGVGVHATCCFAGLDIAPNHRCHITFVVHEAGVEVGRFIRVRTDDMRRATGERVLQETTTKSVYIPPAVFMVR